MTFRTGAADFGELKPIAEARVLRDLPMNANSLAPAESAIVDSGEAAFV
jgi:hypothetical protein